MQLGFNQLRLVSTEAAAKSSPIAPALSKLKFHLGSQQNLAPAVTTASVCTGPGMEMILSRNSMQDMGNGTRQNRVLV